MGTNQFNIKLRRILREILLDTIVYQRSHLKLDPALVVVALAHGDVVGGSLPLDLAHLLRMLERAPLQKQ